jgi:hypothetical protein
VAVFGDDATGCEANYATLVRDLSSLGTVVPVYH